MNFPTSYSEILERIEQIDVEAYGRTRNFKNGAVSNLSPYISRGIISTKFVYDNIKASGASFHAAEKFLQELAWRDYWQLLWLVKGNAIFKDLKHKQSPVMSHAMPRAILEAKTGIKAIDEALITIKETGYMHNHMRMYVASIVCNIAQTHWKVGADWMYSQLLDGDLASNYLSWQWVAGTNSNKKYYANQENINKFFGTDQSGTFLDTSYDALPNMELPDVLAERSEFELKTDLSHLETDDITPSTLSLIHTYYNIDYQKNKTKQIQNILLLEPEHFKRYPVTQHCIDFTLKLAKNMDGIKIFVGAFDELLELLGEENIIFKEHPTHQHFKGNRLERDWMTSIKGDFPSFFKFWNKAKKELSYE
ncbi:deoxyribodipyrimidine photo-lyase [Lishizhenia tianjinensis]|uniref:Deoxyribodipyrimidine photo-lyase n=1 Tax=Lishizhenia tianjinensis TaxID=477690 RepID=A0A1I6XV04_9FLAO|nr:FAD-binding domain-containing protein [Lishizhenia tianjinensis]SFT41833.1 deoxyribodipyrimidine photo-lyase [Lishizhenia tianjinensis]